MELEKTHLELKSLKELSEKISPDKPGFIQPEDIIYTIEYTRKNLCPICPITPSCSIKAKEEFVLGAKLPFEGTIYFNSSPQCKKRNPTFKNSEQRFKKALTTEHKSFINRFLPWSKQNEIKKDKSKKRGWPLVGPGSKSKRKP